jgi:outer membrane protein OmpA-like peptidoglycan-associated protein
MRAADAMVWICSVMISLIGPRWSAPAMAADPCLNPAAAEVVACLAPARRGIKLGGQAQSPAGRSRVMVRPNRVDYTLTFATGSAVPQPGTLPLLDGFGQALGAPELAGMRFRVEGHTDTTGNRQLNLALSQRRAEMVVSYLAQKFPVAAGRLVAVGKGQEELPVPTDDQIDEPRNRIVRIVPAEN